MASYALVAALSGFRYSAVKKTLWFGPRLEARPFKSFFSTATGFGTIELERDALHVRLIEGDLAVERLVLRGAAGEKTLDWKTTVRQGKTESIRIAG
jgi:hypothetical protein